MQRRVAVRQTLLRSLRGLSVATSVALVASCSGGAPSEDPGPIGHSTSALTVDQEIAKGGCTSSVVQGLSDQILEELTVCLEPGFLVKVPSAGNLVNDANHPFLEKPAADALHKALKAKPGSTLTVNSMFRTVAQQYVLYRQASCFPAVAAPGSSNHETGIAFDTSDTSTWQSTLEAQGFVWLGSFDPVHFDFKGAGAVDLRGKDVLAFQRLWNRNHASDRIAEDGGWGPETEARLKISPAGGFAIGAVCGSGDAGSDAGHDAGKPDVASDAPSDATDAGAGAGKDAHVGDGGLDASSADDTGASDADLDSGSENAEAASGSCACRASGPTASSEQIAWFSSGFIIALSVLRGRRRSRVSTRRTLV